MQIGRSKPSQHRGTPAMTTKYEQLYNSLDGLFYRRSGPSWLWRASVFFLALCFAALTALLIPLSDLLTAPPTATIEYRTVDITEWQPPAKPLPPPPPKPPPPQEPPPDTTRPLPQLQPQQMAPPPKIRLPIKLDFALSDFDTNVTLDFDVDPLVEVIPEVAVPSPPAPPPPPLPPPNPERLDRQPAILSQVKPVYPYRARTRRLEGYVDVQFTVTSDGLVEGATALQASPPDVFERAAVEAVSRWRFSPGIRDGQAATSRMQIRIRFTLDQ